jgi:hypothetical protein
MPPRGGIGCAEVNKFNKSGKRVPAGGDHARPQPQQSVSPAGPSPGLRPPSPVPTGEGVVLLPCLSGRQARGAGESSADARQSDASNCRTRSAPSPGAADVLNGLPIGKSAIQQVGKPAVRTAQMRARCGLEPALLCWWTARLCQRVIQALTNSSPTIKSAATVKAESGSSSK